MKRNFPVWLGIIIVLSAGYFIFNILSEPSNTQQPANQQSKDSNKSELQSAPDFTLTDLDGNNVSLTDFKGKNIYLNFWASWCGPCKLEMPDIEKIHQEYKDKDLVVLAVNLGENKNKVTSFINANKFSFTVLVDPQGKTARSYQVSSIPVSVFINKEGLIVSKRAGLMTYSQMEAYVNDLI